MAKLLDSAAVMQLARVYQVKVLRQLHYIVMHYIYTHDRHKIRTGPDETVTTADDVIRGRLSECLSSAALDALLTARLARDERAEKEVYTLVYGWLMSDNAAVMQYLDVGGRPPGQYRGEVADRLKREIQTALSDLVQEDHPLPTDVAELHGIIRKLESDNRKLVQDLQKGEPL